MTESEINSFSRAGQFPPTSTAARDRCSPSGRALLLRRKRKTPNQRPHQLGECTAKPEALWFGVDGGEVRGCPLKITAGSHFHSAFSKAS
jgi:hypothetical protein